MITAAEEITNAIAKLILEDADIQQYCQDNFSRPLLGEDNIIVSDVLYIKDKPSFSVTKLPGEKHNFNSNLATEIQSEWEIMVSFFGNFGKAQITDTDFELPDGAEEIINGVSTYTPSDVMRVLARKALLVVYNKINCSVPGVLVSEGEVDAEDYYDATSGEVKSFTKICLYKKSTLYN